MGAKICGKCKLGYAMDACPNCTNAATRTVAATIRIGQPSDSDEGMAVAVPGKPCPTCGKPYGKSQAQRSREWRARQR